MGVKEDCELCNNWEDGGEGRGEGTRRGAKLCEVIENGTVYYFSPFLTGTPFFESYAKMGRRMKWRIVSPTNQKWCKIFMTAAIKARKKRAKNVR